MNEIHEEIHEEFAFIKLAIEKEVNLEAYYLES